MVFDFFLNFSYFDASLFFVWYLKKNKKYRAEYFKCLDSEIQLMYANLYKYQKKEDNFP